jgi:GH15 family glucan-1,4-alpha-glucosidase
MHPLKDYYITGDLHSAALIAKNGSVEWLCFPNFDSPSIFASLLDEEAGSFKIDMPDYTTDDHYIENTGIIEFSFSNKKNKFKVHDFMVPQEVKECNNHFFVRKLIGVKEKVKVKLFYDPKPDYARRGADILQKNTTLQTFIEENKMVLHFPESCKIEKKNTGYELTVELKENEEKSFVIEYIMNKNNSVIKGQDLEKSTLDFWNKWVKKGHYFNYYKHQLIRSMITLKMMQFYPTGAFVAAPTTSLPEEIGGIRNWDYRFVWIRDATFTLYAFHIADYTEEAEGFFRFVQEIARRHKQKEFEINTVYTIWGDEAPTEIELSMKGYKNSNPVRAGNDATNQFQLDVYGSLIDAHYFMAENQKDSIILDKDSIMALVDKIRLKWMEPDRGIWEVRNNQFHNTYSKVMCWVGIDRTLRMKEDLGLSKKEVDELRELRSNIYNWIWENCYDSSGGNLMQFAGSQEVDATNFLFVLVQFLDKNSDITKKIMENTYSRLSENKIFIYRYHSGDGLKGKESSFVLCIYWYISALAIIGEIKKSSEIFKAFEKYVSKTGLISEQIDTDSGEYLGNYPQAFSHLGLVMSVYYLDRYGNKG